MSLYEPNAQGLVDARAGDGRSYRQDDQPVVTRLKPGEVYAVRCRDRPDYFRIVLIKRVELTGGFQVMVSNPVYGNTPDGVQEDPQEQVFKQMRELNAGTSMASLNAFPSTLVRASSDAGSEGIQGGCRSRRTEPCP